MNEQEAFSYRELQKTIFRHEARIAKLEAALTKCIDTFDDMQRVLKLLGRPVLADACAVAADSSRDVLTPSAKPGDA